MNRTKAPSRPPRRRASELLASEIRGQVEERGLQQGDRLGTEAQLIEEFGVSRNTLREALRLLAGAHLIRSSQGPRGGVFVGTPPNEAMARNLSESVATMVTSNSLSLFDLLEARLFLEVPLAGMAARRADVDCVEQMAAALADAAGEVVGEPAFNEADGRFHRGLARGAGNDLLVALTGWILDVLQPWLHDHIAPAVSSEEIIAEHRAILEAVRHGRHRAAEAAMDAHLRGLLRAAHQLEPAAGPADRG
jgi:GntR family transcriptional repressor for pyruvate dehydrogenase complex